MLTSSVRTASTSSAAAARIARCWRARGDDERLAVAPRLGAREVDRHRDEQQRQDHERERESDHCLDRREDEHVVADVAAEDRIGGAERRAVHRLQRRAPLRRHRERDEEGDERRPGKRERAQDPRGVCTDRRRDAGDVGDRLAHAGRAGHQTVERVPRVAIEDGERDRAADDRDAPLRDDLRDEDALVSDLGEPEPVGEPRRDARQHDHEREQDDHRADGEPRWQWWAPRPRSAKTWRRTDARVAQAADERVVFGDDVRHARTYGRMRPPVVRSGVYRQFA
jgi:hypothetical protein